MRVVVKWVGWILCVASAALILLGIAAWPPGGLMFASPFVFLIPGAVFGVVGGVLVWVSIGDRKGKSSL